MSEPGPSVAPHTECAQDSNRGIARFLYCQNPFYLLSVAFVLHGTGLWYQANRGPHSTWILIGIISAYIMMMAGTGVAIVRLGRVWDDARSILLTLILLFIELAMTADDILVDSQLYASGVAMLLTAWLVSAGVTEFILLSLKIRLRALYRIPFHLMLALLVLYPLAIVRGDFPHNQTATVTSIFLFSPLASLALLTLIPAIRRGPDYVANNGTPWRWPMFPLSLFVVTGVTLVLRSYALSLSYDPVLDLPWTDALNMTSRFGGAFIVPFLLALSVLCLEGCLVSGGTWLRRFGLTLPFVALYVAVPDTSTPTLYLSFVELMTEHVASPVWMTAALSLLIFTYAAIRRVRNAGLSLALTLLVLSCLGPTTLDLTAPVALQPLPLGIGAVLLIHAGWKHSCTARLALGTLCSAALLATFLPANWESFEVGVAIWHLVTVALLVAGLRTDDLLAQILRSIAALMLFVACIGSPIASLSGPEEIPDILYEVHMAGVAAASLILMRKPDPALRFSGAANIAGTVAVGVGRLVMVILRLPGGQGILWALGGLVWFTLAAFISARKAGLKWTSRWQNSDDNEVTVT